MAFYRCGPTAALGSRASWGPASAPAPQSPRPLSGHFDRIFNAFERTTAFELVSDAPGKEERRVAHQDVVCNRKMSSSYERADCALAAQTPSSEDEEFYREKILYSQARQLFPLQEDLADWINKTIGIDYLTGENFLDALDNGAELCQLAAAIHARAHAADQGLVDGPVPQIRGRCWQRAARRSFFSRDNAENFITFCREMGVHENLLFESDDLVLHNQPRQVVVCLLELARLAARRGVEPPGLVQLEAEIALEERDAALAAAAAAEPSAADWQFRDRSPRPPDRSMQQPSPDPNECQVGADNEDNADNADAESTKSGGTAHSSDSDVPLRPADELDKRVQLVSRLMARGCRCGAGAGRCARLLKVRKLGEGRYNIAGRNVFIRLLKGRHMMVRVGGGWDTLEHFLSRHEPCQVRLVAPAASRRRPELVDLAAPCTTSTSTSTSPEPSKTSSGKSSPAPSKTSSGKTSPVPGKTSSGKISPAPGKTSSGKSSPVPSKTSSGTASPVEPALARRPKGDARRASTPKLTQRPLKVALTLPLNVETRPAKHNVTLPPADGRPAAAAAAAATRARKQSAPSSFNTPTTPGRTARTPPAEFRKSLTTTSLLNAPKKSRSMSLATTPKEEKKSFCGTNRLNQVKKSLSGQVSTRKTRSQSLASTPVEPSKPLTDGCKKTRSMSLAPPESPEPPEPPAGALTQAAIERSIRLSLEAAIADGAKKPFLHIKAKYRSPPPREVPPR